MKIGAPYIYVEKLNQKKKTEYDVHVAVMLDMQQRAVRIPDTPFKVEDGIEYFKVEIIIDENLSGTNLFHLTVPRRGKSVDIQHIRILVPQWHESVDASHHHTGGSGSFEP